MYSDEYHVNGFQYNSFENNTVLFDGMELLVNN